VCKGYHKLQELLLFSFTIRARIDGSRMIDSAIQIKNTGTAQGKEKAKLYYYSQI